mgnify:CR=1 FL=1
MSDEYGSDDYEWDELDEYDPDDEWKPPEPTPEERKKREKWIWEHLMTEEQRRFIREFTEVFTPPPDFYKK